jgi:hypothetical protein
LRCSHVSVFLTNSYTRFLLRKENRANRKRGAQRQWQPSKSSYS